LWSGVELHPSTIVQHSEDQSHYQRSSGFTHYGSMSLPVADIVAVGAAMTGCDLTPPKDPLILTPPPLAIAKLLRLHAAAGRLAKEAPEIIANPDAVRGLEQALIEAMVGCLSSGSVHEDTVAQRQHELIMRRFRRVLEEKLGQSLYITEICKLIGVSERTLKVCCQEQLGVGPKRYLVLRRLHLARRALREAAPDRTTVTDIATRYGFWHFGRFAAEYQSQFGELPSVTLHRQAK
jgi:AraC-like DNA-binding protein